jgi:hypothetical protein
MSQNKIPPANHKLAFLQDVLKEPAEYWGIPAWLGGKFSPAEHAYPWPMRDTSGFTTWACGYFSQDVSNAFQQEHPDF